MTAEFWNNFFSNVPENLNMPNNSNPEPFEDNLNKPTFKVILKCRNHQIILAIQGKYRDDLKEIQR